MALSDDRALVGKNPALSPDPRPRRSKSRSSSLSDKAFISVTSSVTEIQLQITFACASWALKVLSQKGSNGFWSFVWTYFRM